MEIQTPSPVIIYYTCWDMESQSSHVLLKDAVFRYCQGPCMPEGRKLIHYDDTEDAFTIMKGSHGKPYIREYPHIHFSISHSGSFWACAIYNQEVGLDLQKTDVRNWERLPGRFFHPDECLWMEGRTREDFCRLWAFKESYVKFNGKGLSQELSSFSVISKDTLSLSGAPEVCQREISFPDPDYALVVTTKRPARYRLHGSLSNHSSTPCSLRIASVSSTSS
ncbi:MAG: 4'-phosphopantetheinyl transferase superfamily protein [Eubacterium sp.]|nr:4'-phosphopantetheinyl transferase superfamily protein [Eubacterium sp.]